MSKDVVTLVGILAWPVVALMALVYVWRVDLVRHLLKVADAVSEIRPLLRNLAEVEEKLRAGAKTISTVTEQLRRVDDRITELHSDIEGIRDRVDQRADFSTDEVALQKPISNLNILFHEMEHSWNGVLSTLAEKFGQFDKRSVAAAAYRFAHGNRKFYRLSYELADDIGQLHSTMKSYRRRQGTLDDWLDEETKNQFIAGANRATDLLRNLQPVSANEAIAINE